MANRAYVGLLAALLSAGCARGNPDGSGGGGDAVPIDDLPGAYAMARCAAADDCLGSLHELFFGGNECVPVLQKVIEDGAFQNLKDAIDAGRIVYHGDRAGDCLDALEALGCDALGNQLPEACRDALEGTVEEGGACGLDEECIGDAFCDTTGDVCPGTCEPRHAAGGACTEDAHCQFGLVCGATERCVMPAVAGEACEGPSAPACAAGLLCVGADETSSGTCSHLDDVLVAAVGEDCDPRAGIWCQEGLSCVITGSDPVMGPSLECQRPVASGADCHPGIPDPCPSGEYCGGITMPGMFDGTCEALPTDGEACASVLVGPSCAAGHACVDDVCRTVQRNGGGCMAGSQCYSGNCVGGACVPDPACVP